MLASHLLLLCIIDGFSNNGGADLGGVDVANHGLAKPVIALQRFLGSLGDGYFDAHQQAVIINLFIKENHLVDLQSSIQGPDRDRLGDVMAGIAGVPDWVTEVEEGAILVGSLHDDLPSQVHITLAVEFHGKVQGHEGEEVVATPLNDAQDARVPLAPGRLEVFDKDLFVLFADAGVSATDIMHLDDGTCLEDIPRDLVDFNTNNSLL